MVEFQRGDDGDVGAVVKKFRTLIKEGCVVFIPLGDKIPAGSKMEILPEILDDAPDHKGRIYSSTAKGCSQE